MKDRQAGVKAVALQAQQLVSEREAARILSVSPTTLSTWRSRHRYQLPFVRLGGARSVRYRLSDLRRFIESGLVGGDAEGGDV